MSTQRTSTRSRQKNPTSRYNRDWKSWFTGDRADLPSEDTEFLVLLGESDAYEPATDAITESIARAVYHTGQPRSSVSELLGPMLKGYSKEMEGWSPEKRAEALAKATAYGDSIIEWRRWRGTLPPAVPATPSDPDQAQSSNGGKS